MIKINNKNIKISLPSYIIPGTYYENILFINEKLDFIDNIELLFYFIDDETFELFKKEFAGVVYFNNRFEYSFHLPDDIISNFKNIEKLLNFVYNLKKSNFIIHSPDLKKNGFENNLNHFYVFFEKYFNLKDKFNSYNFLIENFVERDFSFINKDRFKNENICFDLGHIYKRNEIPENFILKNNIKIERIKEIHFHGLYNGKDHSIFDYIFLRDNFENLKSFFKILLQNIENDLIINIEVFSLEEFNILYRLLLKLLDKLNF